MCSKAKWFRAHNSVYRSVATSLPSNSLLVARAGNVELDRYPQLMLPGQKSANMPDLDWTLSVPLRRSWAEVCRWITYLAGSSSSWELRAGRTGPTVIALPRLQTAIKNGAKTRPRLLKLNYRSLPVGPQCGKDDRREYVRGGVLHGG